MIAISLNFSTLMSILLCRRLLSVEHRGTQMGRGSRFGIANSKVSKIHTIMNFLLEYFRGQLFLHQMYQIFDKMQKKTVTSGRTSPASKESRIFFSSTDPTDSSDSIFSRSSEKELKNTPNKPRTLVVVRT